MSRKKGYTLIETVVAMALAMLVLATVTTTIVTAVRSSSKIKLSDYAARECENISTCFMSDDFEGGLSFLYGETVALLVADDSAEKTLTLYFRGENRVEQSKADWKINIKVAPVGSKSELTLSAVKLDGEEVLYECKYSKSQA